MANGAPGRRSCYVGGALEEGGRTQREEELEEPGMPHLEEKRMGELMALGKMDRNSLVEYTVTVYYTRTLARETHDLPTFIDQV